jgi:hypothetical protein
VVARGSQGLAPATLCKLPLLTFPGNTTVPMELSVGCQAVSATMASWRA